MKKGLGQYDPMMDPTMMDPAMQDPAMYDPMFQDPSMIPEMMDPMFDPAMNPMLDPGTVPVPMSPSYTPTLSPTITPYDPMAPYDPMTDHALMYENMESTLKNAEKAAYVSPVEAMRLAEEKWMKRDLRYVMLEEIVYHMKGLNYAPDLQTSARFSAELMQRLWKMMPDKNLLSVFNQIKKSESDHDAFDLSLKPARDQVDVLYNSRMPVTKRVRELDDDIKSLKGFIANTMEGNPVAAWMYQKFTDQATAIRLLSQYQTEVTQKRSELSTFNFAIEKKNAEIISIYDTYYATHCDRSEIETQWRDLAVKYAGLHPEMAMRTLRYEVGREALEMEVTIDAIKAENRTQAIKDRELYLDFIVRRANEEMKKGNLKDAYERAVDDVRWRSLFLQEGKRILDNEKIVFENAAKELENTGNWLATRSEVYMLFNQGEMQSKSQQLQSDAEQLKWKNNRFSGKTYIFGEKAKIIKDELSEAVARHDAVKAIYDARQTYIHSKEFNARMLREFKEFTEWRETHADLINMLHTNGYEERLTQFYAGPGGVKHYSGLARMVNFLLAPTAGIDIPSWPSESNISAWNTTDDPATKAAKEALYDSLVKRMPFRKQEASNRIVTVKTMYDLYMAPKEFKDKVMENAKGYGWKPKDKRYMNKEIINAQSIFNEKMNRLSKIMGRLEIDLLLKAGVSAVDFSSMTPIQKYELYKVGKKYLKAVTPLIKPVQLETVKTRLKIDNGTASEDERTAFIEALKRTKRYAFWTYVMRNVSETGAALERETNVKAG